MSRTTFSGPVASDNGFEGNIDATSATIGSITISGAATASSGVVSAQIGFIPVSIGGVTKYIALYTSVTL
jgi:hypothetical protein